MKLKTGLITYHGNAELKAAHDAYIQADIESDRLMAGTYGQALDGGWEGCMWGCYVRHEYPHAVVEERLGIPRPISMIADSLFESLNRYATTEDGQEFVSAFFKAVPVGVDLYPVYPRFMRWIFTEFKDKIEDEQVKNVVERTISIFSRLEVGEEIPDREVDDLYKAALAARAALDSLDSLAVRAARAALDSLDSLAVRAALAARLAARDALAARLAARDALAARLAARDASYKRIASKLIEMVGETTNELQPVA